MIRHAGLYLATLLTLLAASGASCPTLRRQVVDPAPVVFNAPPTMVEIIQAVNSNSDPVRQLQAESATLNVQGLPGLRANLALERPRRFRLHAEMVGFPQLDLGSNDELFWMWAKPIEPPAVYFARHEQFASSAARQILPVEPDWLIQALGLVRLDPSGHHEGPFPAGADRVKVVTHLPSPDNAATWTRTMIIDDKRGWVLEQHLHDERGRLLASARASQHRYYPLERVSLPQQVAIQLSPPANPALAATMPLAFEIEIGTYTINQLMADPAQLWTPPQMDGYPMTNLADPRFTAPSNASLGPPTYAPARSGYRPRYRGAEGGRR